MFKSLGFQRISELFFCTKIRTLSTLFLGIILLISLLGFSPLVGARSLKIYLHKGDKSERVYQQIMPNAGRLQLLLLRTLGMMTSYDANVREGRYEIGKNRSVFTVFRSLRNGSETPIRISFQPRLRTREELASHLALYFSADKVQFLRALEDDTLLHKFGVNKESVLSLFLPYTFEMFWSTSPVGVLSRMHSESQRYWTSRRRDKAKAQGLTPTEAYILASIVEKETNYNPEKVRVAGMYLNRLRTNMPLQADPTVVFAIGDFDIHRVMHKDLFVDSPYNTYRHKGLPPGPICVPSFETLEAVLNAERHNYIYMCAKEDLSGAHIFTHSYEEHLKNARRFAEALDKLGISGEE